MRVLLLLLFVYLQCCYGEVSAPTKFVIRGQSTSLNCPIAILTCGEIHSIKWFKGLERIAVASGDGKITKAEGPLRERLRLEFHGKLIRLDIDSVTIDDEGLYSCEITYLEPIESCDTFDEYKINLSVVVPPSAILMLNKDETVIRNSSTIGPLKEGNRLEIACEVRGARPKPNVAWYRGAKKLTHQTTTIDEERHDLYDVKSKLSLTLSRQELGSILECRVGTTPDNPIISNQVYLDLEVRPTKIHLSGVKSHVVEGSKVLLQCEVEGARPAANISWYNTSKLIDESSQLTTISTTASPKHDGTYHTVSQMIFTAMRYENNAIFRCEADNIVMRNEMDKPLHDSIPLEVLYPPLVVVRSDKTVVNETEEFLLFCEYDANPVSLHTVRWLQNSTVLNLNQSRFNGGNPELTALLVRNATREDSGTYFCELSNQVGTGMSEIGVVIDVQYKPTVSIRFEPTSPVIENDRVNVTLHCDVVDGNPRKLLKVQWMINGEVLTELPECNEDSFSDDNNNADDDDDDDDEDSNEDYETKTKRNQNYFCFIDPTKILLQNVNREFLGNYSCRGLNTAGWGDESRWKLLNVFYAPGNASISVYPQVPLKRKSMTLRCSVEDSGNPSSKRYHWLRGNELVKDIVSHEWIIDPVLLHSRNKYSCYALNEGGNGTMATINVEVQTAPTFITTLPQYSGFLYSEPNIMLTCRVECVPKCSIYWFRDGEEITNRNERYFIKEVPLPADKSTGDFESILSELHFNISTWPNVRLDILKDSANYTCSSSNNSVGLGVRSVTSFGVEYPPENVTVSQQEVQVVEGKTPARVICHASAHPVPNYQWKRWDTNEVFIRNSAALTFPNGLNRTDKGVYSCIVENKHGSNVANITMNILYAPNCTITRKEENGEDALVCVADGNPEEYQYEWDFKSDNETDADKSFNVETRNKKSYLILGDVPQKRVYVCRANNTVGPGSQCEISVEGHLLWWHKLWPLTPLIIVALVVACLIAVIILICIIICMCRRRRKRSSKSMEKSLMDKPNDPNAEPCENYENLPFHGLQNPPTKFNYLTAQPANNHLNVNLVHQQQIKTPFVSHPPYSEHYCYESSSGNNNNIRTYNSSTPNSTIRSVKNYRKPHPPVASSGGGGGGSMNASYNVVNMNTSTTTASSHNTSYSTSSTAAATNPLIMTNNLNNSKSKSNHIINNNNNNNNQHHSYTNSYKYSNSNNNNINSNVSQSNSNNTTSNLNSNNHLSYTTKQQHPTADTSTNLSRRSSQQSTSSSHEWMSTEKPHSLSLCINRINLKKSNKSSSNSSSSSSGAAQFQSMRCRKHRNRNHFFNTSSSTAYQRYKLTKSCSNDTVNSSEQPELNDKNPPPPTTYKFI